jgi:hypothetical protein
MTASMHGETVLTPAIEELEASFIRGDDLPGFHAGLRLLPATEVPPPGTQGSGAADDLAMRPTVRTSSSRCC